MKSKTGILLFFYKIVMFCYKKLHIWKVPVPGKENVKTDLNQIYPGENQQECVTDYYVTKLTFSVVIFMVGIVIAIILNCKEKEKNIIESHMFPLNLLHLPRCKEAWILILIDRVCSTREIFTPKDKRAI